MSSETELEIIDRLGVPTVADKLGLSHEGVRLWRVKGNVPEHRREEIRKLGAKYTCNAGQPTWHDMPSNLPMVVVQSPTGRIVGADAWAKVEAAIAERQAELAGNDVETMRQVSMLSADRPVRGYGLRLAGLFALDFPVLTMAFASVAEVSPIVAAGSAIALSLFLVAGAHLLGGVLRKAVVYLPRWCSDPSLLVILLGFLVAIVAVTWDLRMQGLDLDTLSRAGDQALVFGADDASSSELPAPLRSTIGRARWSRSAACCSASPGAIVCPEEAHVPAGDRRAVLAHLVCPAKRDPQVGFRCRWRHCLAHQSWCSSFWQATATCSGKRDNIFNKFEEGLKDCHRRRLNFERG